MGWLQRRREARAEAKRIALKAESAALEVVVEAKRVAEQRKLVGRVVRAKPNGCACGQDRLKVAELWRLTDIVHDDIDYHAVPLGKEKEWGGNYEYLCPGGFELVEEPNGR